MRFLGASFMALMPHSNIAPLPNPHRKENNIDNLVVQRLADVQPEAINWLWQGVLAAGKLTLIGGNPGVGKSQLASNIIASVTTGGTFIDGSQASLGSVVFVGVEDGIADTLHPRMEAAGANLSKIFILQGKREYTSNGEVITLLDITKDLNKLEHLIHSIGDVRLIIFDPINDYLGDGKQNDNAEMRNALVPLASFAEKHKVSVLAITHLKKSSGFNSDPIDSFISSRAFTGVARCVWAVSKASGNETNRLFIPVKNNLEKDIGGYSFTIESSKTPAGIKTSVIKWDSEPITQSATELMRDSINNEEASALNRAESFLKDWFWEESCIETKIMEKEAKDAGIAHRTLERARTKLGAYSRKGAKGWHWVLPDATREQLYRNKTSNVQVSSPTTPSPPLYRVPVNF